MLPEESFPKRVEVGDEIAVDPKNPFSSTSWWGNLTAVVAFGFVLAVRKGWLPSDIEQPVRDLSLDVIAGIIAAAVAAYGRWKATRPLGLSATPVQKTVK